MNSELSVNLNLILTQKQQIRSWFQDEVLASLSKVGTLTIFAPEDCRREIETLSKVKVEYYATLSDSSIEEDVFLQLLARNSHGKSYKLITRNHFSLGRFKPLRPSTINSWIYVFFRRMYFIRLLKSPSFSNQVSRRVNQFIDSSLLNFPRASISIVVANVSDLRTEIVSQSLNQMDAKWMMVAENWDNISSKLDTNRNPTYLGVWSPQTARHANELYKFPKERIRVIGSARVNRETISKLQRSVPKGVGLESKTVTIFYPGAGVQYETLAFISELKESINSHSSLVNLIYRPHPLSIKEYGVDFFKQWESEIEIDWPQISDRNIGDWPVLDSKLYEKMFGADLVIGTPSTFLLESVALNKPILLDMRSLRRGVSPRTVFEKSQHFREILQSGLVPKMYSVRDARNLVLQTLSTPQDLSDLRSDLIYLSNAGFGENLAKTLSLMLR